MEEVFAEKHAVSASLVADVHQYIYKASGTCCSHTSLPINGSVHNVSIPKLIQIYKTP